MTIEIVDAPRQSGRNNSEKWSAALDACLAARPKACKIPVAEFGKRKLGGISSYFTKLCRDRGLKGHSRIIGTDAYLWIEADASEEGKA